MFKESEVWRDVQLHFQFPIWGLFSITPRHHLQGSNLPHEGTFLCLPRCHMNWNVQVERDPERQACGLIHLSASPSPSTPRPEPAPPSGLSPGAQLALCLMNRRSHIAAGSVALTYVRAECAVISVNPWRCSERKKKEKKRWCPLPQCAHLGQQRPKNWSHGLSSVSGFRAEVQQLPQVQSGHCVCARNAVGCSYSCSCRYDSLNMQEHFEPLWRGLSAKSKHSLLLIDYISQEHDKGGSDRWFCCLIGLT